MKYKIILTTYDTQVIEALDKLGRKKNQFVEKAIALFLETKRGKDMLKVMTKGSGRERNATDDQKERSKKAEKSGSLNLDEFL